MPIRPLSAELADIAKNLLNEDPKRIEDSLAHLHDWISKQPHLRPRTDDQTLVVFLRACKYRLERTKERIDLFYSMRSIAPEICRINIRDPKYREIQQQGISLILRKTASPTSPRILLLRLGSFDAKKFAMTDVFLLGSALIQILFMEDDQAVICGLEIIVDMKDVTMAHMVQLTPALMKKVMLMLQEAAPMRMKGTYFINTLPAFATVFNILKSFIKEKHLNRLHVPNRDYETLYKHIPKHILPEEYGGDGGTVQSIIDHWTNKLDEYQWLEDDLAFGTDESKRPGKPRTAEDMFGIDGSFRQIEFD